MKFLVSSGCYGEIAKTLIFCLINQDRFLDRSPLDRLGKLLLIVYSAIMRSLARQATVQFGMGIQKERVYGLLATASLLGHWEALFSHTS